MAVDDDRVRAHIRRALAAHDGVPDLSRRLTRAFRLIQAQRRDPTVPADADLAAAEQYLFARQAVAGNAVSLTQMLVMAASHGDPTGAVPRLAGGELTSERPRSCATTTQDCVGWAVAGAMQGERDRQVHLPGSTPPPFKTSFAQPSARTAIRRA